MPINTTAIAALLRPGLAAVFGMYPDYPSQWTEIFDQYESDKAVEIEYEMRYLGLAQIRSEGAPTAMDNNAGQRIQTSYVNRYVGLGFQITRQAQVDNLYKSKFPEMARALKKSLDQTKEILGASILNNGFNAAFPIGDGQPFFSLNHPIDGGVYANRPTVLAGLNEASLEQAIIGIQQFRDMANLICMTKPEKLIVGPQNQFVAERLLGSAFRTNTPNNDISAIYNLSSIPQSYRVNQFISQQAGPTNSWYVKTDMPGLKYYSREARESDVYTDMLTDNLICKAIERYSFGVSNARSMWGSFG